VSRHIPKLHEIARLLPSEAHWIYELIDEMNGMPAPTKPACDCTNANHECNERDGCKVLARIAGMGRPCA
jgi:hypothetical protein